MSPTVGINPTLMTQLINGMKRASTTIPDVGLQVERALTSLNIPLWGPTPMIRLPLLVHPPDQRHRSLTFRLQGSPTLGHG
ncbi:hypothetical protein [Nonomuraea lactucae]|uniref:hypothetical protein n=1 Tax=Nonomuraea lactucae TaxID=2249762 RepID=UPI000DE22A3B|nr:hypothetical protein [Nonomuraea lactucae]